MNRLIVKAAPKELPELEALLADWGDSFGRIMQTRIMGHTLTCISDWRPSMLGAILAGWLSKPRTILLIEIKPLKPAELEAEAVAFEQAKVQPLTAPAQIPAEPGQLARPDAHLEAAFEARTESED